MATSHDRPAGPAGAPEPTRQPAPPQAAQPLRHADWISYAVAVVQQTPRAGDDFSPSCPR